jgi:hypothetical protein
MYTLNYKALLKQDNNRLDPVRKLIEFFPEQQKYYTCLSWNVGCGYVKKS